MAVYRGRQSAAEWLAGSTGGVPNRAIALEELMMLWLANLNPAFRRFSELFADEDACQIHGIQTTHGGAARVLRNPSALWS